MSKFYELSSLPFGFAALAPSISEEQLRIHYEKHHTAYVKAANQILDKVDKARKDGGEIDQKAELKALSFNIGGHLLHSLFWQNLSPAGEDGGRLEGEIKGLIEAQYGSFDRFKGEFAKTALSVEGSGWAALTYCDHTDRLILMQVEKHNTNIHPTLYIIMIVDLFEHAYYLDYKNDRGRYMESIWNVINWKEVNKRLLSVRKA